jgi:signal transduction histidine kinase/tetratricopeptide (TPR) repeat protein
MRGHHKRQLTLFLAILILPTLAIVVQGRMIASRDRAIAETRIQERMTDVRRRVAAEISQDMLAALERIKGQEIANSSNGIPQPGTYSDPSVVLVGRINGNQPMWPWNDYAGSDPRHLVFLFSLRSARFGRLATEASREQDNKRASDLYRALIGIAQLDEEYAYARLGLARTLRQGGAQSEATALYLKVLKIDSEHVDENRISFASLAAADLAEMGVATSDVLNRVRRDLEIGKSLLPVQTARWKSILEILQGSGDKTVATTAKSLLDQLLKRARDLETAMAVPEFATLQTEFPKMSLTPTTWQPFRGSNNEVWLVGRAAGRSWPPPDGKFERDYMRAVFTPLVIVIRADSVLPKRRAMSPQDSESDRIWRSATEKFQIQLDADGELLNEDQLPRLRVTFPDLRLETMAGGTLGQTFYAWSLVTIVPLTFLCGYLVWRDTRRDVRIAELRSHFVSSVSHELRTPLTAIRMFAEALQMKYTADPRVHQEYLDTIVNESERLTRLLNNVLDFSRIDRGQKSYQMTPSPLSEAVRTAAQTMEYPLQKQGFVLDLTVDDQIPPTAIDRDAIQQAILNLLANAMKYSGDSRNIGLELHRDGDSAVIQVSDHGIGIPEAEQTQIFNAFYRAPIPENQFIAGTGLGLALVAHVAEAHGGSVHVQSNPGAGSTFSIRIPLRVGGSA